jgi:hypothetical protein
VVEVMRMLHPGERVAKRTKKVGQVAPVGRVMSVHGDAIEVKWDDGHTSVLSPIGLAKVKSPKR